VDEQERPIAPDGWNEELQCWEDEEEDEDSGFIPGESPDPYWFND
jgi:hypothetical protein